MITWDDFQTTCQDLISDTTAATLVFLKRLGNAGYHSILADLGRPITEKTQTAATVASQQYYQLPSEALFVKSVTVTVSSIPYPLEEIPDQNSWDALNADLTSTSNIPTYYFVRPGFGIAGTEIGIFPKPTSTGNTITVIYESTDKDLSNDKYTTGTVTLAEGEATVTGSGTTFTTAMVGRYFKGDVDGVWYRIASYISATAIELENVYEGTAGAGLSFTIAEIFNLPEDLHILPVYYAVSHYFDIRGDTDKSLKFRSLYEIGLNAAKRRWATKTRGVVVGKHRRFRFRDPNLPPPALV